MNLRGQVAWEADTQSFSEIRQVATTLILLFCKKKKMLPLVLPELSSAWLSQK